MNEYSTKGEYKVGDNFSFNTYGASNGAQISLTQKTIEVIHELSEKLLENRLSEEIKIDQKTFRSIVIQVYVNYYANGNFSEINREVARNFRKSIKKALALRGSEFTHYFPVWTIGIDAIHPFSLGPVTFMTRDAWIDSVDYPETAKENLDSENKVNWKDALREMLSEPQKMKANSNLANWTYDFVNVCPSICKITTKGYDKEIAQKFAKNVCRTALDSISLLFGGKRFFSQATVYGDRVVPVSTSSIIETNGLLWSPGLKLSERVRTLDGEQIEECCSENTDIISALSYILSELLDLDNARHPQLIQRWSMALEWLAEGSREENDAISLSKIGTSLDVLANAGKSENITEMVCNLLDVTPESIATKKPVEITTKRAIEIIYNDGRSKILHGTHYDRLKSYESEKKLGQFIAQQCLLNAALRIQNYSGEDDNQAFRSMK